MPSSLVSRAILIFGLSLAVHIAGIWCLPLIDRDEPRFAEAAREMRQRGDWIVPWFNDAVRFDKPPLIYWTQIACYAVLGENETAARLPSAVFAAGVAVILYIFGRRFSIETGRATGQSEQVGIWSATIFTLCLQTIMHAKAAVADMAMVFFVALSLWSAWECGRRLRAKNSGVGANASGWILWSLVFQVAMGLGFLAKGPVAWLPLIPFFWFARRAKATPAQYAILTVGLFVCVGIVAAWGLPAQALTKGEYYKVGIQKHVLERGFVAQEGHGSKNLWEYLLLLPFFVLLAFVSFFPWSIRFPALIRDAWRRRHGRDDGQILWVFVLLVFGIFTLYKTKLPHYTLPAFPALSLLFAVWWFETGRESKFLRRSAIGMIAFVCVFGVCGGFIGEQFAARQVQRILMDQTREDTNIGSISYKEPSTVWSLRAKSAGWHHELKASNVAKFAAGDGHRIVVMPSDLKCDLGLAATWPAYQANGFNPARSGRYEKLTIRVKPVSGSE
jgi:4-amino-4-deoxy-L-arabinose transferase-like glycosyltransferase